MSKKYKHRLKVTLTSSAIFLFIFALSLQKPPQKSSSQKLSYLTRKIFIKNIKNDNNTDFY